jgi:hypothetical protein
MMITHERRVDDSWEFSSYRALILDAETDEAGAAAYVTILQDPQAGIDLDEGEAIPTEVGVVDAAPLGDLVDGEFIASGPDRKHSSEALDILFNYYTESRTVRVPGTEVRVAQLARRAAYLESVADDPERVEGDLGRVLKVAMSVLRRGDARRTEAAQMVVRLAEIIGIPFPEGA